MKRIIVDIRKTAIVLAFASFIKSRKQLYGPVKYLTVGENLGTLS